MKDGLREYAKGLLPKVFRYHAKNAYRNTKTFAARRAFAEAGTSPAWLRPVMLEKLQREYAYPSTISYAPEALRKGAEQRVKKIYRRLGSRISQCRRFLDVACGEGTLDAALSNQGKSVAGIDIRKVFKPAIGPHGALFMQMDAAETGFRDESFDCVYSLASFEHFADPEKVMDEMVRVARRGGLLYLHFGPLFLTAYGLHAYHSLSVPFCQVLFPDDVLTGFCLANRLSPPDYSSLNQWTLDDFRDLWRKFAGRLRTLRYYEYKNVDFMDLIVRFPSCFRSKTDNFEDFIVPEIEVLFQKL